MTNDRTTLLVRLREVTNASSDASGNPVRKLHTAEHGVLYTEPGASVGYSVENFLPRDAAERARGRLVALTLAPNGRVVGIDRPRIGLPEPVAAPALSDAAVEAAARALRIEEVGDSAPPGFAARQWDIGETPREKPMRLARAALTAALPFLGPDGHHVISGECSHADDCPCFTISPRADR